MQTLLQLGFVALWIWTLTPAQGSIRVLYWRTTAVLGYGWLASAMQFDAGLLTLICQWLVLIHVIGVCSSVWNRDSRFFRHRYGGCQEV
jgi:hypothetical protein